MTNPAFDMNVPYVRSLTYEASGKVNNSTLAHILTRGIGGAADFIIASDAERNLGVLVHKYGIDLRVHAEAASRIGFSSLADGRKTAETLRETGIYIPKYVEDVILCGQILEQISPERFQIFDVDDDPNAGGQVPHFTKKLKLPIEYIVERWNFDLFDNPAIREKLREALNRKPQNVELAKFNLGRRVQYDWELADEAFAAMDTKGIVKNLFGDPVWRVDAMDYGRALLNATIQALERQRAKSTEHQTEFIQKLYALFLSYMSRITQ